MKKSLANQIAKLWNENLAGTYEPTKTEAIVCKELKEYAVEIRPCGKNNGSSFHHHEEVTYVERAFKVNAYIGQDHEHKLYARIF